MGFLSKLAKSIGKAFSSLGSGLGIGSKSKNNPAPAPLPTPTRTVNLSTTQIAGLSGAQIRAITTEDISFLSEEQLDAFTTSQVMEFATEQIAALTPAQIPLLSAEQIAAFTTEQVQTGLSTLQIVSLNTEQAKALTTTQLKALSTSQISSIETEDIAALSTTQIQAGLSTDQIIALTTEQFAALSTDQLRSLSTTQVAAIQTADIAALTTDQMLALGTSQLQALTTAQIVALETTDFAALSTTQLSALSTDQKMVLSGDQINALTLEQSTALGMISPIVLDLNGNGISTVNVASGVQFDLDATGEKLTTGWITAGDGLLALDRNQDGVINDGSELFGTATTLANGERASNGYVAMQELDSNQDGFLSRDDTAWKNLRLWVDSNSDGVSQTDEIKTLDDFGIIRLALDASTSTDTDNGNLIGLRSSYQTLDGQMHQMADVWFQTTAGKSTQANTESLLSSVSGLVEAMDSFNQASDTSRPDDTGRLSLTGTANVQNGLIGNLAGALRNFDPNGNPVAQPGSVLATPSVPRSEILATNPLASGVLPGGR